jgi:hypothetical protein
VVMSVVTWLGERAIYFSPSDVDFLFPAPFSRRQLLLYKIISNVTAAIFLALVLPMSLVLYIRSWAAAIVGFFLAWLMVNSLTMCIQLAAQSVTERAFTRARKLLLAGLIAAAAVAAGHAVSRGLGGGWRETLLQARHSPIAEILLAPFSVFAKIIAAERLVPDALGWAAIGAILVAAVYALAIRLDANYLETAVRVSRQMQQRRRRIMSEGIFASQSKRVMQSSRLPQPPWLAGIGPLVWRQAIQLRRGSSAAVVLIVILLIGFGAVLALATRQDHKLSEVTPHMVIGVAGYLALLFSVQIPFGFRGDYERMDLLKSLPIRPTAMACGQTLVFALIVALVQWLAFTATAVAQPAAAAELLVAGIFALPFNWILFGTENLLFLLYPSPVVTSGSEGFFKMGSVMLFMLAKVLVLGGCAAVVAIPTVVIYLVTKSILAACVAAGLALFFPILGILLLVAWAFQRYDVSAAVSD